MVSTNFDLGAIKSSMEKLNQTWQTISKNIYDQQQTEESTNKDSGSNNNKKSPEKDDIKDADFEVVDDEK